MCHPRSVGGSCDPAGPMGRCLEGRMAAQLKLTDAQKAKMGTIKAQHAVALNAKRQAMQEAHKAFQQAALNPGTSLDQLKKLHQTVADSQFELMLEHRAMRLEMRALLTPEQQAEADKLCKEMPARGQGGRGGRGKGMGW